MHPKNLRIEDFTYQLPDDKVARYPLEERDASKLLVYRDGIITDTIYKNIASYIPQGSLLVFNQSKVVHARLLFAKPTGGIIEIFCLEPGEEFGAIQTAMLQTGKVTWECLIGGAKKWKSGTTLTLDCKKGAFILTATRAENDLQQKKGTTTTVLLEWDNPALTFAEVLQYAGKVPLPPYLNRSAEVKDESRYQTIFAKDAGSVAAPTAGLHFTPGVLDSLTAKNISKTFVTLHVGAGTFAPVKAATMLDHQMHSEWMEVDKVAIQQLLEHSNGNIIAVGTTSMRILESLYYIGVKLLQDTPINWNGLAVTQWEPYETDHSATITEALNALLKHLGQTGIKKIVTRTKIMIAPGYHFKLAQGLVTNFHQPNSTLLLLVAALIGDNWKTVYDHALQNGYRFLSYGDGCLLLR